MGFFTPQNVAFFFRFQPKNFRMAGNFKKYFDPSRGISQTLKPEILGSHFLKIVMGIFLSFFKFR